MINIKDSLQYDKDGMLGILEKFPEEAKEAYTKFKTMRLPSAYKNPDNIFICAVGGSAIGGDLFKIYLTHRSEIPVIVNRSNYIPKFVNSNTLSILISYSGMTKEVLNCFDELKKRDSKIIILTSGGTLQELAVRYYLPCVNLKTGKPSRTAMGEILYSLLGIFEQLPSLIIKKEDVLESLSVLHSLQTQLCLSCSPDKNVAMQMAKHLTDKTPVILGITNLTDAVALRWKNQFNENSKKTAFNYFFPEITHNDIVNLSLNDYPDWQVIVLRDFEETPLITRQINLTTGLLCGHVSGISELSGQGNNLLSRQMSLAYFGDYVTVYLALLKGINPTPIQPIQNLKQML